jgi:hypothetical protein
MVLNGKVLRRRQLNNNETQVTSQFYKSQKQLLTRKDLDGILGGLRKKGSKAYDNFDIKLIRVLNGANWVSFTDYDDLENYYNGKVRNDEKFYEFSQVQITSIYS